MDGRDRQGSRQHKSALDDIAQLADVARPAMLVQHSEGLGIDVGHGHVVAAGAVADEPRRQQGDVRAPVTQRGQGDDQDVEAVIEVLAETARRGLGREVAVGRRDQAKVHPMMTMNLEGLKEMAAVAVYFQEYPKGYSSRHDNKVWL